MPNWCSCSLIVTGDVAEVARFKEKVKSRDKPLSLNSLVPLPVEFETGDGWYHWCNTEWGTKWDVDAYLERDEAKILKYTFDSAWSPPIEWVTKVGLIFSNLSFRLWYAEGGEDFAGIYRVKGSDAYNESKDHLQAHIDEYGGYETLCEHCQEDFVIKERNAPLVCDTCIKHRCANCGNLDEAHTEGKCPFESTMFQNFLTEKI